MYPFTLLLEVSVKSGGSFLHGGCLLGWAAAISTNVCVCLSWMAMAIKRKPLPFKRHQNVESSGFDFTARWPCSPLIVYGCILLRGLNILHASVPLWKCHPSGYRAYALEIINDGVWLGGDIWKAANAVGVGGGGWQWETRRLMRTLQHVFR